jgi:hypothetical protein
MLQAGRLRVRVPMRSIDFSIDLVPSSRTMTLRWTQPLTEMSARNFGGEGGGKRPAHKADNVTAICEPIV